MSADPSAASPDAGDWLVHGGAMGRHIRAMDWSRTPLGPRGAWPQSLRTTVALCLASNFPTAIAWGAECTQLYNDGYRAICGAKHPQALGQDFRVCWASAWPAIGAAFEQARAGRSAFLLNQRMFLDRTGHLEETFFTFSFSPIRDDGGAVVGLFHPVTELTQQSLAERRLEALRTLAAVSAPGMAPTAVAAADALASCALDLPFALIYLVDEEGRQARLAATVGLPPGTAMSPVQPLLDPAPQPAHPWPLAEVFARAHSEQVDRLDERWGGLACGPYPERPRTALVMPLRPPGQDRPLGLLVAGVSARRPLDAPYRAFHELLAGTLASVLAAARAAEIEHRRVQAEADIDRAKAAFLAHVGHELHTPLTLMLGPLEDALAQAGAEAAPGGAPREPVETAYRNALRLQKLVSALLDLTRIEAGLARAHFVPTDLARLTAELTGLFESAVHAGGVALVVDCAPLPEPLYVDPALWEGIVLNLVSNAFKFTLEGHITVRLAWQAGQAVLTVSDTGSGIPPEHLPRVFERFHRVPHARSRSCEGSGIGLALVKELVQLHGGCIRVDSRPGEGSCFTVTLPAGTAHLPPGQLGTAAPHPVRRPEVQAFVQEAQQWLLPVPGAPGAVAAATGRRARIVLADDNADMRRYLASQLAPFWDVETVADGAQALAAVRRRRPDLVLSDILMPGLDGFGLLRELRADAHTRTLPVILISARAGEEAQGPGLEAGADDYLVKPFTARELQSRVSSQLELARLRRESESVKAALAEKEVLLKEIHHRVKNNLQVISSLLQLQRRQLQDPALIEIFNDAEHRVRAMALVHERLYQQQLAELDFGDYLRGLLQQLLRSSGLDRALALELQLQPLRLPADVAIPLALMASELVTNALKYAYRERAGGVLRIALEAEGPGRLALTVVDDGPGLPLDFDPETSTSLGVRLVRMLAEQLQGRAEFGAAPGTRCRVSVPVAWSMAGAAVEPAPPG